MAYQQPQPCRILEPHQARAITKACDSNDTAPLAHLVEALDPSAGYLTPGLVAAIKANHIDMVRYLLDLGAPAKGSAVQAALQAKSISILEMLREFGWDVNMRLADGGVALTALQWVHS